MKTVLTIILFLLTNFANAETWNCDLKNLEGPAEDRMYFKRNKDYFISSSLFEPFLIVKENDYRILLAHKGGTDLMVSLFKKDKSAFLIDMSYRLQMAGDCEIKNE